MGTVAERVQNNRLWRRSLASAMLGLCLWLVLPAHGLARALIRFLHAAPGVGRATITVNDGTGSHTVGAVDFSQATPWRSIRTGTFHWSVRGGVKTLASGTATVGRGAYDIVVLDAGPGLRLGIYESSGGRPGRSLLRVIHAAPGLGSPRVQLDSGVAAASLRFTRATPYLSVTPGLHTLSATGPGDSAPLVPADRVQLTSGDAYSAVVVGSRGQMVRTVSVVDRGAPLVRRAAPVKSSMPSRLRSVPATTLISRTIGRGRPMAAGGAWWSDPATHCGASPGACFPRGPARRQWPRS